MVTSSLTRPVQLSPQPSVARHELGQLLADAGWGGDVDAVLLAVHEGMVNAQRHGGGVRAATASVEGDEVVIEICDRGRGFSVPQVPDQPDASAERGRGLFLIRRLTADAKVVVRGRHDVCLRMRFEE